MKKIIAAAISLLFAFCMIIPGFAVSENAYLYDPSGLLSAEETASVNAALREVSGKYACDLFACVVPSLNGNRSETYAKQLFDSAASVFGREAGEDGMIFLFSVEDREWAAYASGKCKKAFKNDERTQIAEDMTAELRAGDYASAFRTYADSCGRILEKYEKGSFLYRLTHQAALIPVGILITLLIGFVLAGIPIAKLKAEINNVKWKSDASDYSRKGSMRVAQSFDTFLYKNTTREKVASSSSKSGSSGSSSSGKI